MRAPLSALLILLLPTSAQAQVQAPPAKLGLCVSCHGQSGRSTVSGTPHLGGQDRAYLVASLKAYRSGSRKSAPMNSIANMLQPAEIAALAAWYARQPGLGRR